MNTAIKPLENRWVRSQEGIFAGVCEGVGRRFGIDPWVIRLGWLLSVFALGTGLFLYIILAFCLPREDQLSEAYKNKFLGVCSRISASTGLEIGLVRSIAVMLGVASLGTTFIGYIILHFVVPESNAINHSIVI
jgi:phage shock protein C